MSHSHILVTGGSGFLANSIITTLLSRGHTVTTTVRSAAKATALQSQHPSINIKIVPDMSQLSAFDAAVTNHTPPLTAVIHTASPFHYSITNIKTDMLDPAVNGTVGILQSIHKFAPSVNRVVITSSFAAMSNPLKPAGEKYSEKDWNPVTWATAEQPENALSQAGYRTSKALAEKEAWKFMEDEKPRFSLTVLNPSLIFGPVSPALSSLEEVNTSNQRIRDLVSGKFRERCPPTGSQFWVDVRDAAMAHVVAVEKTGDEVEGKRFFLTAGNFCNADIVQVLGEAFPEVKDGLPQGEALREGRFPEGGPKYGFDNEASVQGLGVVYRSLMESVVDTVRSLRVVEGRQ
ncbi:putative NADPH-dependent methylglyoxal reductase GRE2 [Aspergillus heteromorphus CBS 117.55]|uniref:Putative NADPH-dependent methylglyoxal reductase GRE2 n=1 Tax=Aspergillus heteromorphus CBS 117.55 TaxID=1448321 RepID=A0A317WF01_9EURO|nr:putative NADPH-dependent methylglyoxal reductase GRE2 [Aspergillus heteromorphus CBS 117.55]PWY85014.1 putative NADPH-dependent methylglyoxal reductase GRE2 [Aspergillus heteromorphus CBS 117.55]